MNRAIVIKSCQKNRDRQTACENTWGGELRARGVRVAIVEGGFDGNCGGPPMFSLSCGDDYLDNSFKLQQALYSARQFHPGARGWFICDDDTFIHPERWLAHEPAGEFEGRLYYPNPDEAKHRGSEPWINGGAGWWMSRRMCELYVEHCQERTSADDIVAARIAQAHGIEIIDRPDLYGDSRYSDAPEVSEVNAMITCHPVSPQRMEELWSQLLQGC